MLLAHCEKGVGIGEIMKTRCIEDTDFNLKLSFGTLSQRIDQVCVKRKVKFNLKYSSVPLVEVR